MYRNLELLERLGLVWHTHLGKGAPVYHVAEHPHLHVVCSVCGEVSSVDPAILDDAAERLAAAARFHRGRRPRRAHRDVPCVPATIGDLMTSSPLLARPGAVRQEGGAVAAHYGDPLREQRTLAEGAGLVDRSDRDVLAVPGADRLSWLHSLTSQHLDALADGTGTEALVLSPNGHVEHHLVLADLDGTTWIDVEPGTGAGARAPSCRRCGSCSASSRRT